MNKKLVDAINEQMNFEFYSAHIYLSMASQAASKGLNGFQNWLFCQYEEEVSHAKKMFHYLNDRGETAVLTGFQNPETEFGTILELTETALGHEKEVTDRINNLMSIAHEVKDYASVSFLQWFIDEQVEEEASFDDLITKIKLVNDGSGLYHLDNELSTRTFVDEANSK